MSTRPLRVRRLGVQPCAPVWRAMTAFTQARGPDAPDELWLVRFDPVFTLGRAATADEVPAPDGVPVVRVDGGGTADYHGPGKIIACPLIDTRRASLDAPAFAYRLEQAAIDALAEWNIAGTRQAGARGVCVAGARIASLEVDVHDGRGCGTLACNVAMDLRPFSRIQSRHGRSPRVAQLHDFGGPSRLADVEEALVIELARQFGSAPEPAEPRLPRGA